ncbi:MAG: hypothetical protein HKL89_08185 [Candidatus Dormibacteraeota bacterium]|nr:hypothetical protein [Candidatus Dormibacteraeota bacterium]
MPALRRRLPLLVALALLLSACGSPAGSSSGVSAAPQRSAGSAPYPGANASGFQAVDMTWVSANQGWALGVAPGCLGQRCVTVMETTDGGHHWVTVTDLHDCLLEAAPVGCPAGVPQVSRIRFANADVGYAFAGDGGPFSMTTNGGLSWAIQPGRQASAIKVGGGSAVRVSFSQGGCPGPCDWSIDRAALGQNSWVTLFTPPTSVNHGNVDLLRQGSHDIYAAFLGNPASGAGSQEAQLYVSTDGGTTWTAHLDPCARTKHPAYVASALAAAPGGVLAALCGSRSGVGPQMVTVSSDQGASFGPMEPLPHLTSGIFSELSATSAKALFVASPAVEMVETSTGGQSWRVAVRVKAQITPTTPQSTFLGFETPLVGRWIGPPDTLWTTTDGGGNWSASKF